MSNDTVGANAPASSPKTATAKAKSKPETSAADDEYLRLQAAQIGAMARFNVSTEKRREEANRAELDAHCARREAFEKAEARWLRALAAVRDSETDDDKEMGILYNDETDAKRHLFQTRPADSSQLWALIECFERDLHEELRDGPLSNSVLLFELAAIKAAILDLVDD